MNGTKNLRLEKILEFYIANPERHRRLLNTFSMMENMGAQKIHRFQRFGFTSEFLLRHASEEARHALSFKSKTKLLGLGDDIDFSKNSLVAPFASRCYLRQLDIEVNRYLKLNYGCKDKRRFMLAYLFTTLLIELRANDLYPTYEKLLRKAGSQISIRSIISEENRHLREIESMLTKQLDMAVKPAITYLQQGENRLYAAWLNEIGLEMVAVQ